MDVYNPITLDFETYYDKDYSIKKLTNEQYIRSPKFECIGVSVKDGADPTIFFKGDDWVEYLSSILADPKNKNRPVVAHNALFDGGVLALNYGIHPDHLADTEAMAAVAVLNSYAKGGSLDALSKALIELGYNMPSKGTYVSDMCGVHRDEMTEEQWQKYAEYCKTDTDICYAVYMELVHIVPFDEMRMIDVTLRMYTNPKFEFDIPLLQDYERRLETKRIDNLQSFTNYFGYKTIAEFETAVRSRKQFPQLLEKLGVECPMKWSETQGKMVPALAKTDKGLTDLLHHENPLVGDLVETKMGASSTIELSRCRSFLDLGSRGNVPIPLRYGAAHTWRYGGMDKMNFQNLPKRKGDTTLRRSMVAPKGYVVIATDSSQVEARLLAYAADEQRLVNIFLNGECPYSDMASKIYGIPYEKIYHDAKVEVTKEGKTRRNVGKTTVLGGGYGMGGTSFREKLREAGLIEAMPMADTLIKTYRASNPKIRQFWKTCDEAIEVMLAGGTMSFGGPKNDLFVASGGTEWWGVRIPSVRLPNDTFILYRGLRKVPDPESWTGFSFHYKQWKFNKHIDNYLYGAKMTENIIQALAFAVLKHQALIIDSAGIPVNLNVHDEWVSVVRKEDAKRAIAVHASAMRSSPDYLPNGLLDCEVDIGKNYMDTTTINGV